METVEKSVEINAPVSSVYNQWTQFESFPEIMNNIQEVRQITEKHLHWKARIAGRQVEWDSEIVDQIPDQKISWRSTSGAMNSGTVRFFPEGQSRTRVDVQIEYEPSGPIENVGDAIGVFGRRIEAELNNFKNFIESHQETGAWRGRISGQEVRPEEEPRSKRIR